MTSKVKNYRQAVLHKTENGVDTKIVTWILEKFCVVGKFVRVQRENKEWDPDIWHVESFGRIKRTESEVRERQKSHQRWCKATDI